METAGVGQWKQAQILSEGHSVGRTDPAAASRPPRRRPGRSCAAVRSWTRRRPNRRPVRGSSPGRVDQRSARAGRTYLFYFGSHEAPLVLSGRGSLFPPLEGGISGQTDHASRERHLPSHKAYEGGSDLIGPLKGLYALEWGERILVSGGTSEMSGLRRSRKQAHRCTVCRKVPHRSGGRGYPSWRATRPVLGDSREQSVVIAAR
jgi:hypothetical protein